MRKPDILYATLADREFRLQYISKSTSIQACVGPIYVYDVTLLQYNSMPPIWWCLGLLLWTD